MHLRTPDVPAAILQLHLSFVDMQHRPCDQLRDHPVVGLAISTNKQMPESQELPPVYPDAEDLVEQRSKGPDPEPMRNVLVGKPAHEGVEVPRHPTVALWRKALSAACATVGDGPELHHLPADHSRRDDKIEGALAPRLQVLGAPFRVEGDDVLALAGGAAGRRDFHPVRRP
jgi:hypothetical protein